ncbi:MAG: Integral membrane protein TerC, partial [uncultured Rubrobacteraceae bacterium]
PKRGWSHEHVPCVGLGRVYRLDPGFAGARPARGCPREPGDLLSAGDDTERFLDLPRASLRRGGVSPGGSGARRRVSRGLRDREEPLGRQRVCLRADLLLLRRTRPLPVPGPLLGSSGSIGPAWDLRPRRGGAAGALRLDDLRFRRFLDIHGHPNGAPPRHGGSPRAQPGLARRATRSTHDAGLPGREVLHAPGGEALRHAPVRGHRHDRDDRRHLRRGLHTGDLRHHLEHLRGLVRQRLRGPRAAPFVLHARGYDRPLRLPERRPLDSPRLRRREVHRLGCFRQGTGYLLPAVYRHGSNRLYPCLPLQDARPGTRRAPRRRGSQKEGQRV